MKNDFLNSQGHARNLSMGQFILNIHRSHVSFVSACSWEFSEVNVIFTVGGILPYVKEILSFCYPLLHLLFSDVPGQNID